MSKMLRGSSVLLGDNTIPGLKIPEELKKLVPTIISACRKKGLDFYDIIIEKVTYDEMSEIAAYGGFPIRYPHWRFGMEYEELSRGYEFGMSKIYEMVINTSPCIIYCLDSNTLLDDVLVISHAIAHSDFFKNNIYFEPTDRGMLNKMANHSSRIRRYMNRYGKEQVTKFIDHCLTIDRLIDYMSLLKQQTFKAPITEDKRKYYLHKKVDVENEYMDPWINSKNIIEEQKKQLKIKAAMEELNIKEKPEKDIMRFLRDNAPLTYWQQDIMSMLYEESLYFIPQGMTKISNEGWACLAPDSLVFTDQGLITIGEISNNKMNVNVSDGESVSLVKDWYNCKNKDMVKITTRKGFVLSGSVTHRIWDDNKQWKDLNSLKIGDKINILLGQNIWSNSNEKIQWQPKERVYIKDVLKTCGVCYDTLRDYKKRPNAKRLKLNEIKNAENAVGLIDDSFLSKSRKKIKIPKEFNEKLGSFLGYLVGDGHISTKNREVGLTSSDEQNVKRFCQLSKTLFGLEPKVRWDNSSLNGRWRCIIYSKNLIEFLLHLGLTFGFSARKKVVPNGILRSKKTVVSAFLKSYFDCDGCVAKDAIILSTSSDKMSEQIQVILTNYGIISSRRKSKDGCWQVSIRSKYMTLFMEEIGFGLNRQIQKYKKFKNSRIFYKKSEPIDEIVNIERFVGEVADITVQKTHRYASQGFVNHNSFFDSEMMTVEGLCALGQKTHDSGIVEYAKHKVGVLGGKYSMNPYALGYALFQDIRDRWNKGKFGDEYENCNNLTEKRNWNKNLNLGMEKCFEVRKHCCDVTFILEHFTDEFCEENEFFIWKKEPDGKYVISERDPKKIKKMLLNQIENLGRPQISLVDSNYKDKGCLFLEHGPDVQPLDSKKTQEVLKSIYSIWKKPVFLSSKTIKNELVYVAKEDVCSVLTRVEFEKEYD